MLFEDEQESASYDKRGPNSFLPGKFFMQENNRNNNKTILYTRKDSKQNWFILDATGKTLGRFASEITKILRGKHKPDFTTCSDVGDGVIVINAEKIEMILENWSDNDFQYLKFMCLYDRNTKV